MNNYEILLSTYILLKFATYSTWTSKIYKQTACEKILFQCFCFFDILWKSKA